MAAVPPIGLVLTFCFDQAMLRAFLLNLHIVERLVQFLLQALQVGGIGASYVPFVTDLVNPVLGERH